MTACDEVAEEACTDFSFKIVEAITTAQLGAFCYGAPAGSVSMIGVPQQAGLVKGIPGMKQRLEAVAAAQAKARGVDGNYSTGCVAQFDSAALKKLCRSVFKPNFFNNPVVNTARQGEYEMIQGETSTLGL